MNKSGRIFLACALGAFIGALVALQLGVYLWWTGMIVGGFVGYLSYEFKKVLEAGTYVWRTTCAFDWNRAARATRKKIWAISLVASFWILCMILFFSLIFFLLYLCNTLKTPVVLSEIVSVVFVVSTFLALLSFPALTPSIWGKSDDAIKEGFLRWKTYHPFKVFFYWIPLGIYKTGPFVILQVSRVVALTGRLIKNLFILIHSDERLLCGVDAAIGAAIGYFLGSAFLGAVVGGILGVLNYELVSKRLLGLTHS